MYGSGNGDVEKLTCNVMLRAKRKLFNSTNSNMKLCGRPPSKPSMQSTCRESADWFVIEQFCSGNGRPESN